MSNLFKITIVFLLLSCVDTKSNSSGRSALGGTPDSSQPFTLRTIHLSPNAPNVDVYVNNSLAVNNLPYFSETSYLSLNASNVNVKVNPTGTGSSVINAEISLTSNDNTIIALNNVSTLEAIVIPDERIRPVLGRVKLRVGHGISVVGNVDVYVLPATNNCTGLDSQTPVLTNVSFKDVSGYLEINSGTYDICVALASATTPAIIAQDVVLSSQSVNTIFAVNAKNDFGTFGFMILDDIGVNSPVLLF